MGFFDFISDIDGYSKPVDGAMRLNARHRMIVEPFASEISGATVLDLAAHDGRWSYALAAAGARSVVGIEARPELIDRFDSFPDSDIRARVDIRCGDIFDGIANEIALGRQYDVVAVYGIFYHVMDHFHLIQQIRRLGPKLVIIDSEFMTNPNPMIQLVKERTDNVLNAAPQIDGQNVAIKGIPSFLAMERIAEALDFTIEWVDRSAVPPHARTGIGDYYRTTGMCRATCALRGLPSRPM